MGVIAVIDEKNRKNTFEIGIPKLLSFMSYNKFSGKAGKHAAKNPARATKEEHRKPFKPVDLGWIITISWEIE